MEGKVEPSNQSKSEYESSSEDISDLEDELMGDSVPIISLMDMYKQTFKVPELWGIFNGIRMLLWTILCMVSRRHRDS